MNEEMFLCIIKHPVPKVQQRILSILEQSFKVTQRVIKELTNKEKTAIYGATMPVSKKRVEEAICTIVLLKGDKNKITDIIGNHGDPCKSPLTSIQYKYGEDKKNNGIDCWDANEHIRKVKIFFTEASVHVAWLNRH